MATTADFRRLRDGGAPLYVQIATLMRRRMRSGDWPVGTQLPTLDQLAHQFGVARVTVRQAMDLLESERLIWRRQGKGTFVSAHAKGRHWMSVASEWEDLVRTIEGTEARPLVERDADGLPPVGEDDGTPAPRYRYMRRVHSFDGEPHLSIEIYLDHEIYRRNASEFDGQPVLPVLNGMPDLDLGRAHQTVTVGVADQDIADHLRLNLGDPVVEVRRVLRNAADRIIYFGALNYRTDSFRLEMVLRR